MGLILIDIDDGFGLGYHGAGFPSNYQFLKQYAIKVIQYMSSRFHK